MERRVRIRRGEQDIEPGKIWRRGARISGKDIERGQDMEKGQ
jgi:hypothetical protein